MADRVGSFRTVRVGPTRGRSTHVGFALLAMGATVLAVLTLLPIWRYEAWWVRGQDFRWRGWLGAAMVRVASRHRAAAVTEGKGPRYRAR